MPNHGVGSMGMAAGVGHARSHPHDRADRLDGPDDRCVPPTAITATRSVGRRCTPRPRETSWNWIPTIRPKLPAHDARARRNFCGASPNSGHRPGRDDQWVASPRGTGNPVADVNECISEQWEGPCEDLGVSTPNMTLGPLWLDADGRDPQGASVRVDAWNHSRGRGPPGVEPPRRTRCGQNPEVSPGDDPPPTSAGSPWGPGGLTLRPISRPSER